ncbi:hypothetical protein BDV24DRAFT_149381 [Aspergillus arachidicola]|uniref:Fe2OG dioxygenase domain-containing protein n=1 Tax=Aspergillus arachidicola TaxID=656916 RepID=A0A5N6YGZ9_9EURO|nr:hypothetical protein BDV24DRAFT_149381 [Aspergillus arachidicola]
MVESPIDDGFFYLDLRDWKDGQLVNSLNACNGIVEEWFKKSKEEKAKTVTLSDAHGYKLVGQRSGVKKGQRDGYESLRLSRGAQLSRDPLPEVTILSVLSEATPTNGNVETFLKTHPNNGKQWRSALYFLHHPPKPPGSQGLSQNIHTDAGTLTLLFTQQPGLQVLSPTTGQWEWVHPREGHGVVNVGDTLRFLSEERFRSALHRVLPLTDKDSAPPYDRYSTAYFLRAAEDVVFVGNDGKKTTAEEWFVRKFHSFTQDWSVQRLDSVAVGGYGDFRSERLSITKTEQGQRNMA